MDNHKLDLGNKWLFVDDDPMAASFSDRLNESDELHVVTQPPSISRGALLTGASPMGVLMDVELSQEKGEYGTGLGMAQDVRAAQKAGRSRDYPIVRFARADPVQRNIGGDPASYDLFDDKIDKADLGTDAAGIRRRLMGVRAVYDGMAALLEERGDAATLFGLEGKGVDWVHPGFIARLRDGLSQAIHVAAGAYLRTFLQETGLLFDRRLLLVRLGIDQASGHKNWKEIKQFSSQFAYRGLGCSFYERWWARGLEQAWYNVKGVNEPLASNPSSMRAQTLSSLLGVELKPLAMPPKSPGERPWRWCSLSLEMHPPEYVPVDPKFGVRVSPRIDLPVWCEPLHASLGEAVRNKDDRRLDGADLQRLSARFS